MNADKFVVRGQTYDVLSPATFGDYIETVGAACINPLGYAENKLFLAYDDNVQKLFRATAAIAYSELLIKDTNCEPTTMAEALANALSAGGVSYDNTDSGLTASNVQDAIDEVNGNVETVNSDLSNMTNPNLLDNPWFTVNQRGITSVTTGWTFFADRWKTGADTGGSVVQNADKSITITSTSANDNESIVEFMEPERLDCILGKAVTVSIMLSNNTVVSKTGVLPTSKTSAWHRWVNYFNNDLFIHLNEESDGGWSFYVGVFANKSITIKAVKLEVGTVSTLAQDTAPNYQQELAKCQRYFFKTPTDGYNQSTYHVCAISSQYTTGIAFPVQMRTVPTITDVRIQDMLYQTPQIVTNISAAALISGLLSVNAGDSNLISGSHYYLQFEASADL